MAQRKFGARAGLKKIDKGIRKVAGTYGKAVFLTYGQKAAGLISVESESERLTSHLLCLDPTVRCYQPQPLTVDLQGGTILRTLEEKKAARARHKDGAGGPLFYTPDFLVGWCLGTETAVEVKTQGYEGNAEYEQKLLQATQVLWAHGMEFMQVVLPSNWRHPLLTNAPLLYQAATRTDLRPNLEIMDRVERLADSGINTLGGFCAGLDLDTRMGPVLIAFGALRVDFMEHALHNGTPASPAFGELTHLSVLGRLAK